jgi:hypothetical protein
MGLIAAGKLEVPGLNRARGSAIGVGNP